MVLSSRSRRVAAVCGECAALTATKTQEGVGGPLLDRDGGVSLKVMGPLAYRVTWQIMARVVALDVGRC